MKNVHERIDALELKFEIEKARTDHTEAFLARKFSGEYEPYTVRRAREELANATSQIGPLIDTQWPPRSASIAGGDQPMLSQSSSFTYGPPHSDRQAALSKEFQEIKDLLKAAIPASSQVSSNKDHAEES